MRQVATLGALFFLGASVASAQDDKVEQGEKLYGSNKCSMCHSIAGKGNPKGPLDEVGSKRTAEEIRQWLINPAEMTGKTKSTRKPPMPTYAKLPKEDIDALIAYLLTLKKK
jgi:mono/diheme cytochrome c family protein